MGEYVQTKRERLRQLRLNMLVHSYLYYHLNDSLISDHQWQAQADELVELQKYRHYIGCYDDAFKGWDASTGYHLPVDQWVIHKATQLLNWRDRDCKTPKPRAKLIRQRSLLD